MYITYLDESGSFGDTRVLAIAGYSAQAVEWARLEHAWKKMLKRIGVGVFHMRECLHRRGAFEGRTIDDSREALTQVVDAILSHEVHGIGAAVLLRDYDDVIVGSTREDIGDPWHLCFRHVIKEVAERIDRLPKDEWVAFVCDLQEEYSGEAERLYRRINETPDWPNRRQLGSLTFGSRQDEVGLQVADVLAYETFKHLDDRLYTDRGIRKSLDRLTQGRPFYGEYYDREALLQFAARREFNVS
jgi:hypothetical protein